MYWDKALVQNQVTATEQISISQWRESLQNLIPQQQMYRSAYPSNHNPNQLNLIVVSISRWKVNNLSQVSQRTSFTQRIIKFFRKAIRSIMSSSSLDSNKQNSIMIRLSNKEKKESYQLSKGSDQKYDYLQNINILLL